MYLIILLVNYSFWAGLCFVEVYASTANFSLYAPITVESLEGCWSSPATCSGDSKQSAGTVLFEESHVYHVF